MKKIFLIICEVFKDDLLPLLKDHPEFEVLTLDLGLHSYVEKLESELSEAIDQARAKGMTDIRLIFGWACLPEMKVFAEKKGVKILQTQNCLAAFVGDARLKELEQNRTMVITPAWLKLWPDQMRKYLGWDPVDFRQQCGYYDRLLLLDNAQNPVSDEDILNFYELAQVPIEVMPITFDFFYEGLKEFLKDQ